MNLLTEINFTVIPYRRRGAVAECAVPIINRVQIPAVALSSATLGKSFTRINVSCHQPVLIWYRVSGKVASHWPCVTAYMFIHLRVQRHSRREAPHPTPRTLYWVSANFAFLSRVSMYQKLVWSACVLSMLSIVFTNYSVRLSVRHILVLYVNEYTYCQTLSAIW